MSATPEDQADAIEARLRRLAADAHGLEERVAERTRELVAANEDLAREVADRKRVEAALRASEDQLRQSQKMEAIGRLAGGIAHDFNNALSIILSYSEVLAKWMPEGSPQAANLREIERAGERAAALTAQLLAFGRKEIPAPAIVGLNEVVSRMRDLVQRVIGEDIEVRLDLAPSLGMVEVDPHHVEQIVVNLVANARDAMPDGGVLAITTDDALLDAEYAARHPGVVPGPHVMLSVADSGRGMDAATLTHAFEPFFTTKDVGKGSGLGLATVFGFVHQSGGSVTAQSEPGKGATFRIYFPRVEAAAGAAAPRMAPKPDDGGETILLVEDDGQVRELLGKLLRGRGYNVLFAANAHEAEITSAQYSGEIHLLLTDVVMPKVSGGALAERLARARPTMRALFMSGYTADTVVKSGVRAAGLAFLPKPITPDALAEKVRGVLDGGAAYPGQSGKG